MKKLIQGIIQFHKERRADFVEKFKELAQGQKPDALFIACSDSRMAPNVFASTNPGDLFVIRNVGNLVPPYDHDKAMATAAGVDFAVNNLQVRHIIVCGHSGCGAMEAHCAGHHKLPEGAMKKWLNIAATSDAEGMDVDEASRQNVLAQLEHLKSYPSVIQAIQKKQLGLHGLWFDIAKVDVLYYESDPKEWTVIDDDEGQRLIKRLERP